MKRIFSALLVLCLIIIALPAMAVPTRAAQIQDSLGSLQFADHYNPNTEEWLNATTGVVFKVGNQNYVITNLPSQNGLKSLHSQNGENYFLMNYVSTWNNLYLYHALSEHEAKYGVYQAGTVKAGETVYAICFAEDGYQYVQSTAQAVSNGKITTTDGLQCGIPVPVLNSQFQVCAVLYGEDCWSIESILNSNAPAATEPPATEPPATEPPATEPPATEPPATEPPATEPPATEPPATEPPAEEAPGNEENLAIERPVELKDLDQLYANAIVQKKPSNAGVIAIGCIGALVVILLVAVVITKRKNKRRANEDLNEAEEGTVLADVPMDTGLRLQFRNGKRIAVKHSFTIGRAPDNDVVIPNTSSAVSGRHCEIVVQNGAVYLRDLGSTNGTFINGRRLVTGQLVQLLPGMTVGLGGPSAPDAFSVVLSSK